MADMNPDMADVLFLPVFDNSADYSDQIYRLSWYLPESSGFTALLLTSGKLPLVPPAPYFMIDHERIPTNLRTEIRHTLDRSALGEFLHRVRFVAYWNSRDRALYTEQVTGRGLRELMLDKNDASRREAFEYVRLFLDLEPYEIRKKRKEDAALRLANLIHNLPSVEKVYVFGTGPSLEEARKHDYSDGIRIVCNSIVKNVSLMEHIRPHVIVAADPLFHYGCSRYAARFRAQLIDAIKRFDATFVYPFFYSGLFEHQYPDLISKSIPVPQERREHFVLDLVKEFVVRGIDNVLTLLMLPLASTLGRRIYILGCDGRKPQESYFWQHHAASQYGDLMDGIKECHPGFFNHVVYEDYYESHCANLDQLLREGEQIGKRYISMTTTYIPALISRAL